MGLKNVALIFRWQAWSQIQMHMTHTEALTSTEVKFQDSQGNIDRLAEPKT